MGDQECCSCQGVKNAGLAFVGNIMENNEHKSCREDSEGVKIIRRLVRICFSVANLYHFKVSEM